MKFTLIKRKIPQIKFEIGKAYIHDHSGIIVWCLEVINSSSFKGIAFNAVSPEPVMWDKQFFSLFEGKIEIEF